MKLTHSFVSDTAHLAAYSIYFEVAKKVLVFLAYKFTNNLLIQHLSLYGFFG